VVPILFGRCKVPHKLTAEDLGKDPRLAVVGLKIGETIHEAAGCERCGHVGYRGRQGVFEILEMTDEIRKLVGPITDSHTVDEAAIERGMTTMLADAVVKCRMGTTTVSEVFRVTTLRGRDAYFSLPCVGCERKVDQRQYGSCRRRRSIAEGRGARARSGRPRHSRKARARGCAL